MEVTNLRPPTSSNGTDAVSSSFDFIKEEDFPVMTHALKEKAALTNCKRTKRNSSVKRCRK